MTAGHHALHCSLRCSLRYRVNPYSVLTTRVLPFCTAQHCPYCAAAVWFGSQAVQCHPWPTLRYALPRRYIARGGERTGVAGAGLLSGCELFFTGRKSLFVAFDREGTCNEFERALERAEPPHLTEIAAIDVQEEWIAGGCANIPCHAVASDQHPRR